MNISGFRNDSTLDQELQKTHTGDARNSSQDDAVSAVSVSATDGLCTTAIVNSGAADKSERYKQGFSLLTPKASKFNNSLISDAKQANIPIVLTTKKLQSTAYSETDIDQKVKEVSLGVSDQESPGESTGLILATDNQESNCLADIVPKHQSTNNGGAFAISTGGR